jgi:hypothetical protein
MYSKIVNLKTKLANYNNTLNKSTLFEDKKNLDESILNQSMQIPSSSTNKSFMSTINDLKKKWNDVSNKNKNISPLSSRNHNLNETVVGDTNNRLNEIKSKYNMTKLKNVNLNNSQLKK